MADISVEGWVGLGSGGANATCGWGIGMSDYAALIRPTDVGGVAGDVGLRPAGVIRQTLANVLPNPPPSLIHFPKAPSGRSTKTPIRHHRSGGPAGEGEPFPHLLGMSDRKSTRLNSSHVKISYAVFCLKKKKANI